eukprot:2803111-Heterocapsa_arctica.AAC.1
MSHLVQSCDGIILLIHQCCFGAATVKPTNLFTCDREAGDLFAPRCRHPRGYHKPAVGRSPGGGFKTT